MKDLNLIILACSIGAYCFIVTSIAYIIDCKTGWITKFIMGEKEAPVKPKRKGVIPSAETRAKRSASFLAKMNSEEGHTKWGSPEHKAKLSASAKLQKPVVPESSKKSKSEKLSEAFKGRVFTDESKALISQAKKGATVANGGRKPMSPEGRENVRQARLKRLEKDKNS
jgi:hypothetical protein